MNLDEIVSKIQDETLNIVNLPRTEQIKRYIELYEKYKKGVHNQPSDKPAD